VCDHSAVYEFFRDQGSIIAGLLALLAGVLAYWAGRSQATETREQSNYMKSTAAESDRRAREDLLASFDREAGRIAMLVNRRPELDPFRH
jgi:hypothetical protein